MLLPNFGKSRRLVRARRALSERAHVDEMAGDGRGCCHLRGDEVRAPAIALSTLEIAVRGGGAPLARLELVGVHAKTHGTPGLPPLKSGRHEDLVEPLRLGLLLHETRPRHDHR